MNCWQEGLKIAKQLKHPPSEASAYSSIRFLRFAIGEILKLRFFNIIRRRDKY
jgi:hypothetical protein